VKKLAIIDSHPIQYNAPVFRLLAERGNLEVKVFYTWGESVLEQKFDPGFGKAIEWDIPLLQGYTYEFVDNAAPNPNASSFSGIDNPGIFREIDAWRPDYLLVFGWSFKTNLRVLRHYKGRIPIIFRGDSTLLREQPGFSFKKSLRRVFLRWVYRHVDTALYVGAHNRAYYLKHGLKPSQLVYAPHAIDIERFASADDTRTREALQWRADLGIPAHHLVVLYAGKLEPIKNVDFIVRLAQQMKQTPIHFVIVGNGPEEARLKQSAEGMTNVHFLDFQNQGRMPVVYRLGDVVILCSHSETWGLALNEAMACGKAVAAANTCGGAIELIEEGVNGIIFSHDQPARLQQYLEQLAADPGQLQRAAQYSRERITGFSFEKIAAAIEGVCR
jgi:glycosyltransferase involved in cell wall biosynthesis